MQSNQFVQYADIISRASRVLLVPGAEHALDTLPAALGLAHALAALGKQPAIFYPHALHAHMRALPLQEYVFSDLAQLEDATGTWIYDCMITIGVPTIGDVGSLADAAADFFYITPIINIDIDTENEQYGALALIETSFSSCAELCAHIARRAWQGPLPPHAATAFMAGTLLRTDVFRSSSDAHRTMLAGAHLMNEGAAYQQIVRHVYKTKPASLIRLIGKVLAHTEWDGRTRIFASYLTWRDIHEEHATASLLPQIMQDVCRMWPHAKNVLIAWEDSAPFAQTPSRIRALVRGGRENDLDKYWQTFGGIKKNNYLVFATLAHNSREAALRIAQAISQ